MIWRSTGGGCGLFEVVLGCGCGCGLIEVVLGCGFAVVTVAVFLLLLWLIILLIDRLFYCIVYIILTCYVLKSNI